MGSKILLGVSSSVLQQSSKCYYRLVWRTKRGEFSVSTQQNDKGSRTQTFEFHNQITVHYIYVLSSAVTESHKYVKSCVYSNIQKEFLRVYYYHYYLCKYCLCMPVLDGKRGDGVGAGQGMCHMRRSKDDFQCFFWLWVLRWVQSRRHAWPALLLSGLTHHWVLALLSFFF